MNYISDFYTYLTENANGANNNQDLHEWTKEEVQMAGQHLGINLSKYDYNEVMLGMKIESKHGSQYGNDVNVTGDQAEPTLKLVIGNLRSNNHYYSQMQQLENQQNKQQVMESVYALNDFGKYIDVVKKKSEPIDAVVAAGVLPICKETGRILLVKRSDNSSEPGTWAGIGGKIEEKNGESEERVIDIVKREFFEETACKEHYSLIPSYVYITKKGKFKYYNFIGIFDEEFIPELNEENSDYQWISLEDFRNIDSKDVHFGIKLLFLHDPNIIKKYAK